MFLAQTIRSRFALIGIFCFLLSASAEIGFSQTSTATLTGIVQDSTGAIVPNVAVTATNTDRNTIQTTRTNETGAYVIPALNAGNYSVMPFLWPALARPRLAHLKTQIDRDDVCHQTTAYTCGPAASVTALRKLDIDAGESDLAVCMYTSPALGTPADVLAASLQERYAPLGLTCEYRAFDSVDELPRGTPVLAVVKFSFMVDHYVTVLDIDKDRIIVGDPAAGRLTYTRQQFEQRWRFRGVVLRRQVSGIDYLQAKNTVPDANPALTPAY